VTHISNQCFKPKRSAEELIAMMRDKKGVKFQLCCEQDAISHLQDRNNYLRTAAYRKNFQKHERGKNIGTYIDLDFAYLIELSKLDMYLRSILLKLCIDVEHALKVWVLRSIDNNSAEDGYSIVSAFSADQPQVFDGIVRKHRTPYTGDLIKKYIHIANLNDPTAEYSIDCPAWVLVELLSFKELIQFYTFYCDQYQLHKIVTPAILQQVRNLRNACAHNNCLLTSLAKGQTIPGIQVKQFIADLHCVGSTMQSTKLTTRVLYEIACLLYAYTKCVSKDVMQSGLQSLYEFTNSRLMKNRSYFANNSQLLTSFEFLQKVVDNLAHSTL